jgi:hypothetical protein
LPALAPLLRKAPPSRNDPIPTEPLARLTTDPQLLGALVTAALPHTNTGTLAEPEPELTTDPQLLGARVTAALPHTNTGTLAEPEPELAADPQLALTAVLDRAPRALPHTWIGAVTPAGALGALPPLLAAVQDAFAVPPRPETALPQTWTGTAALARPEPDATELLAVPQLPTAEERTLTALPQPVIGAVTCTPFPPGLIEAGF